MLLSSLLVLLSLAQGPSPPQDLALLSVFERRDPPRARAELRDELARRAADDLAPLVAALREGVPQVGDLWGTAASRHELLAEVLLALDGPRLGRAMASRLRASEEPVRPDVLHFLGRMRSPGSLGLLLEEADRLGPKLRLGVERRAFEAALDERLRASPQAFEELALVLDGRRSETLDVVVALLGSFTGPPLRPVLRALARVDPEHADIYLERGLELELGYPWLYGDENLEGLANLATDGSWRQRRRAAELLARASAAETLWLLLRLLDDPHESVRAAALAGLRRRTGQWGDERSATWRAALEEPLRSFSFELGERRDDLGSASLGTAFRAVRDLAARSHHRHEVAGVLAASLRRQPVLSAVGTTSILARLRSRAAVPGLVAALAAEDPRLSIAAHKTLVTLVGRDRGPRSEDWASFLLGELE